MAEFSKQYCELRDIDFPYDFDLLDEFNRCEDGYYVSCICEGFGSIGVMNDKGICKLAFSNKDGNVKWKSLDEVIKKYKNDK